MYCLEFGIYGNNLLNYKALPIGPCSFQVEVKVMSTLAQPTRLFAAEPELDAYPVWSFLKTQVINIDSTVNP